MKPITINPFIKFGFLLSQIILVLVTHSNKIVLTIIIYSTIILAIRKIEIKQVLNGLKFGLFLAVFIFVFSLIRFTNLQLAIYNGLDLFKVYFAMILVSIVYKLDTSNKELSYVLSVVFSPLKVIGFDQNKLYTLFLMILNQIFALRYQALRMYKYATHKKGNKLTIRETMQLIVPFINSNLKQNELLAIGLINSSYDSSKTQIKPYFITSYKQSYVIILVAILLIETYILI